MNRLLRRLCWIFGLALLPAVASALFHLNVPGRASPGSGPAGEGEITVSDAVALGEAVLWVDARRLQDHQEAHVPGSLPLNEDAWDELLPALLDEWEPERQVVVYCGSEQCKASKEVADRLRNEVGLENVLVLKGGWDAWVENAK